MSGAYFIFPLQLVVVFNLTTTSSRNGLAFYSVILLRLRQVINLDTCLIRNALAIRPLAAGIGAVDRIRPMGVKVFPHPLQTRFCRFSSRRCFKSF